MGYLKTSSSLKEYHINITILFLTILGFFARIYPISSFHYHHDEIWHLFPSNAKTLTDVFYLNLTDDGHPPLMYWMWHYILNFYGQNIIYLRLPSVIFGALTIPVAYLTGKQIFKERAAGIFFALFVALCPLLVEQSQVIRGYSVAVFFAFLAIYYSLKYYESQNFLYFGLQFIFLTLAFLTEFAIIHIAVFTALLTLKTIYESKKARIVKFTLWVATNMFLLSYLLWFRYMIQNFGELAFAGSLNFGHNFHGSYLKVFVPYFIFIVNYISTITIAKFYFGFIEGKAFSLFFVLEFLWVFILLAYGCICSLKNNKLLFIIPLGYLVFILLFDFFGLVPANIPRRNIGLMISFIPLIYIGLTYFFNSKVIKYMGFSYILIIISSYVLEPNPTNRSDYEYDIANYEYTEFQNFIAGNIKEQDVVITDWLTKLYFSLGESKYPKNDSFVKGHNNIHYITHDYRTAPSILSHYDLSKIKNLNDNAYGKIWLIGLGDAIVAKSTWLDKDYNKSLGHFILKNPSDEIRSQLEQIKQEHDYTMVTILHSAKDIYLSCREPRSLYSNCRINMFAISITKEDFRAIFESQPNFLNPRKFLEKVRLYNSSN